VPLVFVPEYLSSNGSQERELCREKKGLERQKKMIKNSLIVSKIKITLFRFNVRHSMKTYSWLFMEQTEDMDA
jgi:hypothetical protein